MAIGDTLVKLANQQPLTEDEKLQLRLWGNQGENVNSFVAGLQNGSSDIFARTLDAINFPIKPIYTKVLEANTPSIEILIPSSYRHILMFVYGKTDNAGTSDNVHGRFNGDTGTNYMEGYTGEYAGSSVGWVGEQTSRDDFGVCFASATSSSSGSTGSSVVFIPHYNSNSWKSALKIMGAGDTSGTALLFSNAVWKNTSPVKKITIFPEFGSNLVVGTVVSMYGLL